MAKYHMFRTYQLSDTIKENTRNALYYVYLIIRLLENNNLLEALTTTFDGVTERP